MLLAHAAHLGAEMLGLEIDGHAVRLHQVEERVGDATPHPLLRGEATGVPTCWNADVVATAKRDLAPGDVLDGEGGYTVWGKLMPAGKSTRMGGLPLGLAHGENR